MSVTQKGGKRKFPTELKLRCPLCADVWNMPSSSVRQRARHEMPPPNRLRGGRDWILDFSAWAVFKPLEEYSWYAIITGFEDLPRRRGRRSCAAQTVRARANSCGHPLTVRVRLRSASPAGAPDWSTLAAPVLSVENGFRAALAGGGSHDKATTAYASPGRAADLHY